MTVTLPPKVYELIMGEATRRKMAKEKNPQLSAILREARELLSGVYGRFTEGFDTPVLLEVKALLDELS
ncbi:hypothetical protein ACFLQ0_04160 [Nitrospinota bacterium]